MIFILLPAYNEEEAIRPLIESLVRTLRPSFEYGIVVVDDGSRDGTAAVVEELAKTLPVRLIRHDVNRGLGAALSTGLRDVIGRCADDDVVVTMDADNTHPADIIPRMIELAVSGRDVVIASRYQRGAGVHGVPAFRRVLSDSGGLLFRMLLPTPGVRDFTCGFRAYRGSMLKKAARHYGDDLVDQAGFTCMLDVLLKLRYLGATFAEVPLILRYDRKPGLSKMRILSTVADTLAVIFKWAGKRPLVRH